MQFILLCVKFFVSKVTLTGSQSAGTMDNCEYGEMQFIVKQWQVSEVFCLQATCLFLKYLYSHPRGKWF